MVRPNAWSPQIRQTDTAGFSGARGRPGASGPGDQLLRFTGNRPLIDALLEEAGIAGAGGSLKDLVAARKWKPASLSQRP